jgi:hypothetical protein
VKNQKEFKNSHESEIEGCFIFLSSQHHFKCQNFVFEIKTCKYLIFDDFNRKHKFMCFFSCSTQLSSAHQKYK